MTTYQEALAVVFRMTSVANGGVTVIRLSSRCGGAYVEDRRGNVVAFTAFDWRTVTADMRERPVEMLFGDDVAPRLARC